MDELKIEERWWHNGNPRWKISRKKSNYIKHGVSKYFYNNGVIYKEETYGDGRLNSEVSFSKGKKEGEQVFYSYMNHPSPGIVERLNWRAGLKNGKRITYYRHGEIHSESFYVDDKKHGIDRYFNKYDGAMFAEDSYCNGERHGKSLLVEGKTVYYYHWHGKGVSEDQFRINELTLALDGVDE